MHLDRSWCCMGYDKVHLVIMSLQIIPCQSHFILTRQFFIPPAYILNSMLLVMGFCTAEGKYFLIFYGINHSCIRWYMLSVTFCAVAPQNSSVCNQLSISKFSWLPSTNNVVKLFLFSHSSQYFSYLKPFFDFIPYAFSNFFHTFISRVRCDTAMFKKFQCLHFGIIS